MATLIICPVCDTRYETQAVFPPEGRKVRCSKCTHVWQAKPVTVEAAPVEQAPRVVEAPLQAPPRKAPSKVPPLPPKPAPQPAARPRPAPPPTNSGAGGFAAAPPFPAQSDPSFDDTMAGAPQVDADFGGGDELSAQAAQMSPEDLAAAFPGGLPGETPSREERRKSRTASVVTIGWILLALLVLGIVGLFALAPQTVTSILPGAERLYSIFGGGSQPQGLSLEGVRYDWTNDGSQTVLEVQGNVINTGSDSVTVPMVVIALRDEKGEEISEWTTEVGEPELAAGEQTAFLRQIPSPPSNVRSLKVRFAKAE
jgi:predicted Zn finger-like uncharacterized protein